MSEILLEIMIPVNAQMRDEEVFAAIESRAIALSLSCSDRKRLIVVAMEMFQNLRKHGDQNRLATLRIRKTSDNRFEISSMNFADTVSSRQISGKFELLSKLTDYRQNFRDKLKKKLSIKEPAGNLGLDICFRNAIQSTFRLFPYPENQNLIFLSFSIENHGKPAN